MVATPEISRLNGAKSRGPRSERGKAIAAQNATKHGLLSTKPPLVLGEDLESFQGIVQGLIDEYQPQTATEQLLVQQVAMGWLRLHRLWGVEAASASIKMIRLERAAKYPETSTIDTALALLAGTQEKQAHSPAVLRAECQVIRELADTVEGWLWELPKRGLKQWLVSQECQATIEQLQQKLGEFRSKLPVESIPPQDSEQFLSCFWRKLTCEMISLEFWQRGDQKNIGSLKTIAQSVIDYCQSTLR